MLKVVSKNLADFISDVFGMMLKTPQVEVVAVADLVTIRKLSFHCKIGVDMGTWSSQSCRPARYYRF